MRLSLSRRIGWGIALLATLTAAAPAGAADQPAVPFTIGGIAFELPAQPGYCQPTGKAAAVTQLVAAADKENVTDLSLVLCGDDAEAALADYTLVKTPVKALLATVSREDLLAALAAEFDKPEFKEFLSRDVAAQTQKNYNDLGAKITLTGAPQALGRDDVCAYMGGTINGTDATGKAHSVLLGGCVTAVGGKVISVFRYVVAGKGKDIGALLRESRAWAMQIRAVPAK